MAFMQFHFHMLPVIIFLDLYAQDVHPCGNSYEIHTRNSPF
jgi:hypothetical protein